MNPNEQKYALEKIDQLEQQLKQTNAQLSTSLNQYYTIQLEMVTTLKEILTKPSTSTPSKISEAKTSIPSQSINTLHAYAAQTTPRAAYATQAPVVSPTMQFASPNQPPVQPVYTQTVNTQQPAMQQPYYGGYQIS